MTSDRGLVPLDDHGHVRADPGEEPPGDLLNRGRRSIGLDLKNPDDQETFDALLARADVVVENYRPGVLDEMGLTGARLAEINEASGDAKALRVAVEGGGCSGFQYEIDLDEPRDDDLVLEGAGQKVVVDQVSLPFLADAVIDFSEELIGARFIIQNPNATSSCGCGTSFSM